MNDQQMIAAEELCNYYHVDSTFIESLYENGLIRITTIQEKVFVDHEELSELEKLVRLHNDLEINVEGIGAVIHLLNKIDQMQQEISGLRHRLNILED